MSETIETWVDEELSEALHQVEVLKQVPGNTTPSRKLRTVEMHKNPFAAYDLKENGPGSLRSPLSLSSVDGARRVLYGGMRPEDDYERDIDTELNV